MTPLILAALFLWPVPPLGPTLGSGTPYHNVVANQATMTALPATGLATYYSPGVFERVLAVRGIAPDACPDCDGWAAMLHAGDMGRVVCVEGLRLLVVDVAADHHRPGLIAKGWVIDIQWEVWQALGYPNAPTPVTVTEC
jgi:hypothetical protein